MEDIFNDTEQLTYDIIVQYCKDNITTPMQELFAFYYDIGVKNGIIPSLTSDEKRAALLKFNNNAKITRQYLLKEFIINHLY